MTMRFSGLRVRLSRWFPPLEKFFVGTFNSLEFEISVLYTAILGLVLLVFSGILYLMIFWTLYAQIDSGLKFTANQITQSLATYVDIKGGGHDALMFAVNRTVAVQGKSPIRWWIIGFERRWFHQLHNMDLEEDFINFLSPDGHSLDYSRNMTPGLGEVFTQHAGLSRNGHLAFHNVSYDHRTIRIVNFPFIYGQGRYILQVGIYQKPIAEALLAWLNSVMVAIPLVLLLAFFLGRVFVRRILDPVEEITAIARRITYEDLGGRVLSRHSYKEMENLSGAFNDMIARLEKSFKHIEEFSYHVAHELKTPLTIIRGEAEVALLSRRKAEDYEQTLKITLEETDNMLRTIHDLLYLSRVDYQIKAFKFQPVDLNEFLTEIYHQAEVLAAAKNIRVSLDLPDAAMTLQADPLHLRRLFLNLVDNALKFTPSGGYLTITARLEGAHVRVSVSDSGKGIPSEELEHIFERFFRTDEAVAGSGLGLSIVQSIAKAHRGRVEVQSQLDHGSIFHVILPATAA